MSLHGSLTDCEDYRDLHTGFTRCNQFHNLFFTAGQPVPAFTAFSFVFNAYLLQRINPDGSSEGQKEFFSDNWFNQIVNNTILHRIDG